MDPAWGAIIAVVSAALAAVITALVLRQSSSRETEPVNVEVGVMDAGAQLIDTLATAGLIIDEYGNVVLQSTNATAMGLVRGNRINMASVGEIVTEVQEFGSPVHRETELTLSSGDSMWVTIKSARAQNGHVLVLVDDQTESYRLDGARREFIANISHELKTPIGAIGLLAEALVDSTNDPQTVKKFAKSLMKESERLSFLVQDIIQLSKVQSNELLSRAIPVDMCNVVNEARDQCAVLAQSRSITVSVDCPGSLYVAGDADLLVVAVKNLIDNALQYSEPRRHVGVGVSATDDTVIVAVADSGIGISLDDQARVFERFFRVDGSRSRQTGGTGLGLSLVKHIALRHGGEVSLFSRVGVGSTFTLKFPRFLPAIDEEKI